MPNCSLALNHADNLIFIEKIINYLDNNPQIKILDLSNTFLQDKGLKLLAKNKTLTHLNLTNNEISNEGAKALAKNKTLTHLNLTNNDISNEGAKALAQNQNLTVLGLSENKIGDKGAEALAQNQNLTVLGLNGNKIGDKGAEALAQNQNLTALSLGGNKIGDKGAEALSHNKILTMLDLGGNKIGDKGAKAFIQNNNTLRDLRIGWNNDISVEVEKQLEERQKKLPFILAVQGGDIHNNITLLKEKIKLALVGANGTKDNPQNDSYLNWMNTNAKGTRGFSRFSHWHHGTSGKRRAIELFDAVNCEEYNYENIFGILNALSNVFHYSSHTDHSLRAYLAKQGVNKEVIYALSTYLAPPVQPVIPQ